MEVHRLIDHSHIFQLWVQVLPDLWTALWVAHPNGGVVPHIFTEVLHWTTVQPEKNKLR